MGIISTLGTYYKEAYRLGHFPSLSRMLSGEKIFAYYGFLGDRNYGDELVFESARHLFAPGIVLPVRRRMPIHLAYLAKAHKDRFAGVIIGGGTLIGPSFYNQHFFEDMRKLGKPIYMHGTGIQKQPAWNNAWKTYLSGKIFGGVRGPLSVGNMSGFREDVNITGDAAFAMFEMATAVCANKESRTVLVNCGAHDPFPYMDQSRQAIEEFVGSLLQSGYQVQFMPCHSVDVELGEALRRRHPAVVLLEIPKVYDEALEHFRKAAFAVGERLHFTAMGILTGCPFLSVNYSAKHDDLLASVELAKAGAAPADVTLRKIQSAFEQRQEFDWVNVFRLIDKYKKFQLSERAAFISAGS